MTILMYWLLQEKGKEKQPQNNNKELQNKHTEALLSS